MRQIIFFLAIVFSNTITSQTATDILHNYIEHKKSEQQYQVSINYKLYKGFSGTKVYESYKGIQARYEDTHYQKLQNMELAQGKNFMVKLNSDEKAMLVGYSSKPIFNEASQIDHTKVLSFFKNKTLEDKDAYWKLTLTSNISELSQFSSIELHIAKDTYRLLKQVFMYASVSDFSMYDDSVDTPDIKNPRLEITYTNYSKDILINKNVFQSDRYFTYTDNKIVAASAFKDFEILYAK